MTKVTVELSGLAGVHLTALVTTGLWGPSREEAARRIIEQFLQKRMDRRVRVKPRPRGPQL